MKAAHFEIKFTVDTSDVESKLAAIQAAVEAILCPDHDNKATSGDCPLLSMFTSVGSIEEVESI